MIFRRINGHIVPIKDKQTLIHGAIESAAGVGTSIGTGIVAAKLVRKSHALTKESRVKFKAGSAALNSLKMGQLTFNDTQTVLTANKTIKSAVKSRLISGKLFSARNTLLLTGATVAGGLLASGLPKIREAVTGKKTKNEVASKAFGVSAAIGAYAAYYNHLPVGSIGKVVMNTFSRLKGMPRPHQASWFK